MSGLLHLSGEWRLKCQRTGSTCFCVGARWAGDGKEANRQGRKGKFSAEGFQRPGFKSGLCPSLCIWSCRNHIVLQVNNNDALHHVCVEELKAPCTLLEGCLLFLLQAKYFGIKLNFRFFSGWSTAAIYRCSKSQEDAWPMGRVVRAGVEWVWPLFVCHVVKVPSLLSPYLFLLLLTLRGCNLEMFGRNPVKIVTDNVCKEVFCQQPYGLPACAAQRVT